MMSRDELIVACSGGASAASLLDSLERWDSQFAELGLLVLRNQEADGVGERLLLDEIRRSQDFQLPFELLAVKVTANFLPGHENHIREAQIKVDIHGGSSHVICEGNGPVNALDNALRKALLPHYPELGNVHLSDYQVSILDPDNATAAQTRVLIEATNGLRSWKTVGVSEDIIEASALALSDSYEYFLVSSPFE